MDRKTNHRNMISSLISSLSHYIPFAPAILLALALLVGVGILAVPERAVAGTMVERNVVVDGVQRHYTVFLPDGVDRRKNLRVMIVYHPALGTGKFMEEATHLHLVKGSQNFIVVYPDGYRRTWNAGDCCGIAKMEHINDVDFFRAMMSDVSTMASVRPKAYITGWSNGALMVYYLLCHASNQVAAAAPFAAYLPPKDFSNCGKGPVPLLHMHGAEDPGAPVNGGETNYLGYLPPARQTVETIARWNGADIGRPTYVDMSKLGTSCLHYTGLSKASEAYLCIIPGLGHVWPGMRASGGTLGADRPDLDGSGAVIDFFLKH